MILGIVQARMSSQRLPGKVLRPIRGRPMLAWQIDRLRKVRGIDRLVVATSTEADDDAIMQFCLGAGVSCYRGSLADVLDRFYQAALHFRADHIVRWTGDCPLIDPEISDRVVALHHETGADYTSNTLRRTFADGLDTEVMSFLALAMAWSAAADPYDREHVTPFLYRNPDRFRCVNLANDRDDSALRWAVDTGEDIPTIERMLSCSTV